MRLGAGKCRQAEQKSALLSSGHGEDRERRKEFIGGRAGHIRFHRLTSILPATSCVYGGTKGTFEFSYYVTHRRVFYTSVKKSILYPGGVSSSFSPCYSCLG